MPRAAEVLAINEGIPFAVVRPELELKIWVWTSRSTVPIRVSQVHALSTWTSPCPTSNSW